jgi:hypothetical protein
MTLDELRQALDYLAVIDEVPGGTKVYMESPLHDPVVRVVYNPEQHEVVIWA